MDGIFSGLMDAFALILTLDRDLLEIVFLSLRVMVTAVITAALIGLPLGAWLVVNRFRFRRFTNSVLNALMGLPPVVVGLFVYLMLSRAAHQSAAVGRAACLDHGGSGRIWPCDWRGRATLTIQRGSDHLDCAGYQQGEFCLCNVSHRARWIGRLMMRWRAKNRPMFFKRRL